jgi:hypothetical protein
MTREAISVDRMVSLQGLDIHGLQSSIAYDFRHKSSVLSALSARRGHWHGRVAPVFLRVSW